jgi:hypothetical protein
VGWGGVGGSQLAPASPARPAVGNGSMPSMKNSSKKPSASSASKQKARVEASGM